MSKEKQIGIKVVTYEEQRLKYFSDLLKKAQARYKRLVQKHKDAHYLSDEFQKMSDVSGEICFLEEVVDMLENGYRKQSEWISVDERLPERCGYYLGCTYKGGLMIAPFFPVFANDKPEFNYKIAYWMPLPEAPKMKGGTE